MDSLRNNLVMNSESLEGRFIALCKPLAGFSRPRFLLPWLLAVTPGLELSPFLSTTLDTV